MKDKLPFEEIKRKIIVRKKATTNTSLGKKPEDRSIEELIQYGIVPLNKGEGPTSHQHVDYLKRILNINRAGHSGTLDPRVTGLLPVALEKATRIVRILLKAGKEYVALMHLHKEIPAEKIRRNLKDFIGKIKQVPPRRSAVKRKLREREIYYLKILEIEGKDVLFKIGCEAGFYIRKFIHDFGKKIGCGAHMAQLIRTKVGPFSDKKWCSLVDLKDAYMFWKENGDEKLLRECIFPFEKAVEHIPKIWILDNAVDNICHGADLYVGGISRLETGINKNDLVAVMSLKGELICYGFSLMTSEEIIGKEKEKAVKTKKVFMERGVYKI